MIRQRSPVPALRHRLILGVCFAASAVAAMPSAASGPVAPRTPDQEPLAAMHRDLGLDARALSQYLDAERMAMVRSQQAQRTLGPAYAGAWLERGDDGRFHLVIAVTKGGAAAQVRALGAQPRTVLHGLARLAAEKSKLDALSRKRKLHSDIHAWYVDVTSNRLVVEVDAKVKSAGISLADLGGVDPALVDVIESPGVPETLSIVGGERYNIGGGWCSIGIPVTRGSDTGFATAGHCAGVGAATSGTNGVSQGVFAGSIYPGVDMAWVRITNPSVWPLSNSVTNYAGSAVPIVGSTPAPVGGMVCRSGAKTGYRCGKVIATGVTINYSTGTVYGLTTTSACVGKGDSGGAYITPSGHAQGVTSGGSSISSSTGTNCGSSSPRSHHQPLNPLMNQFGLTLFTGSPQSPPIITYLNCPRSGDTGDGVYACALQYTSPSPVTVEWVGRVGDGYSGEGYSDFYGSCEEFELVEIYAIVSNSFGSVSTPVQSFMCRMEALP